MIKDYKKIIHLSHNDLEGYSCQYLTNTLGLNIKYLNTHYADLSKNVNLIFKDLLEDKIKTLVLITDLNITQKVADKMNDFKKGNKHLDFDYLVIDHHKTGLEVSLQNKDWYELDVSRCATCLVGQWILDNFDLGIKNKIEVVQFIMEFVDSHDKWLCSFRSKDDIDVERVAREYFFGGGHTNASGGSIKMIDKINSESELIEILLNSFPIKRSRINLLLFIYLNQEH